MQKNKNYNLQILTLFDSSVRAANEVRNRTKYAKNRGFESLRFKFEKNLFAKMHEHFAVFFHIFC